MAQAKPEVNKSQAIRDFVTKNPKILRSRSRHYACRKRRRSQTIMVYTRPWQDEGEEAQAKARKGRSEGSGQGEPSQGNGPASSNGSAKAPSKSAAVRAILKENRKMLASEVVSALAEKGVQVTDSLVYFVKGKMKGQVAARRRTPRRSLPRSPRHRLGRWRCRQDDPEGQGLGYGDWRDEEAEGVGRGFERVGLALSRRRKTTWMQSRRRNAEPFLVFQEMSRFGSALKRTKANFPLRFGTSPSLAWAF